MKWIYPYVFTFHNSFTVTQKKKFKKIWGWSVSPSRVIRSQNKRKEVTSFCGDTHTLRGVHFMNEACEPVFLPFNATALYMYISVIIIIIYQHFPIKKIKRKLCLVVFFFSSVFIFPLLLCLSHQIVFYMAADRKYIIIHK